MQRFFARADAEQQSRSAVRIAKFEAEFRAGERRIDRLLRIESGLALSKFPQASHAISFDAVKRLFIVRSTMSSGTFSILRPEKPARNRIVLHQVVRKNENT